MQFLRAWIAEDAACLTQAQREEWLAPARDASPDDGPEDESATGKATSVQMWDA